MNSTRQPEEIAQPVKGDVVAFFGENGRVFYALVMQVYSGALKLKWLAPKNKKLNHQHPVTLDDFLASPETRITVEDSDCILTVFIPSRFNQDAVQNDTERSSSLCSNESKEGSLIDGIRCFIPSDLSRCNQIDRLRVNALDPLLPSSVYIASISSLMASHVPLFLSMFGSTFRDWIDRMHSSDSLRFTALLEELFNTAYQDQCESSCHTFQSMQDLFLNSSVVCRPKESIGLLIDCATTFLASIGVDSSTYGFRPLESIGLGAYMFEMQGIWQLAVCLAYERSKNQSKETLSVVSREYWSWVYGDLFPFIALRCTRSHLHYLEFEGLVVKVVQGLMEQYLGSVLGRVACRGSGPQDVKMIVYQYFKCKIDAEVERRCRK